MGREIKRVPVDFNWPMDKVWEGFLNPHYKGHCKDCADCGGSGSSGHAKFFSDQWYGNAPFHPYMTGSVPFDERHCIVRARAESAVQRNPEFYGQGERAIVREAVRLAELFNARWCHHLDKHDVRALLKAGRLMDFTHNPRTPEQVEIVKKKMADGGNSWLPKSNGYVPTPQEVNDWSINGFGHDGINNWVVIKAKCKRMGIDPTCSICKGKGSIWDSVENKKTAEDWEKEEPPTGDGWQVWETVSEGSPITPVFPTAEALIDHLADKGDGWDRKRGDPGWGRERAEAFVKAGWVMSMMTVDGKVFESKDIALEMSK